jgi:hypothetical protein
MSGGLVDKAKEASGAIADFAISEVVTHAVEKAAVAAAGKVGGAVVSKGSTLSGIFEASELGHCDTITNRPKDCPPEHPRQATTLPEVRRDFSAKPADTRPSISSAFGRPYGDIPETRRDNRNSGDAGCVIA